MPVHPLSTSSSEVGTTARPAATLALVVVVLFFALDRVVFGVFMPWDWLSTRIPARDLVPAGVISDEKVMRDTRPGDVVLIGASRIDRGFHPERMPDTETAGLRFSIFAHPGMGAVEIRSLVSRIADRDPRLVVLGLSELDSHSYLRFEPCQAGSPTPAVLDVLASASRRFVIDQRQLLLRLAVSGVVNVYRLRRVIRSAGVDRLIRFDLDKRLRRTTLSGKIAAFRRATIRGEAFSVDQILYDDLLARLQAQFPTPGPVRARPYFDLVRSVTRGEHAVILQRLLSGSIAYLAARGIPMVVVELPVHPLSVRLYDPETRAEFRAWAESMRELYSVRFVPLNRQSHYSDGDFFDMTHLNRSGATKLTRVIVDAVRPFASD